MKVVSFSVKNYRSIVEAHKIKLRDYNVLIGKNNEGKSNVIRALNVCMNCIYDYRQFVYGQGKYLSGKQRLYDWERDFPIQLQNRNRGKEIIFDIEFELLEEELIELNNVLNTRITSKNIIMKIKIGPDNIPIISFPKKGTTSLTRKKREVTNFLSDRISTSFIGTIRTKSYVMDHINYMISKELKILEKDQNYINCVLQIKEMQNVVLEDLSKKIKTELNEFLPKVNDVKIRINDDYNLGFSPRDIEMAIDDGVLTDIEYKGDGIKSLSAIALFNNRWDNEMASLLAIDEPESHLHPGAITELSDKLKTISKKSQIIVASHNASFIDIDNIANNIIIDSRIAKPAKNISEIRDILGITVEDYMISSRIKLLVEGESDEKILKKIMIEKSPKLKKSLDSKEIVIVPADGASKIGFQLRLVKNELAKPVVLVDNDESAIKTIKNALDNKLIDMIDVFYLSLPGMKESEIEDIINPSYYEKILQDNYGISINNKRVRSDIKWSDRINEYARYNGKYIDDSILKNIKLDLVKIVEKAGLDAVVPLKLVPIENLIKRLEELIYNKDTN